MQHGIHEQESLLSPSPLSRQSAQQDGTNVSRSSSPVLTRLNGTSNKRKRSQGVQQTLPWAPLQRTGSASTARPAQTPTPAQQAPIAHSLSFQPTMSRVLRPFFSYEILTKSEAAELGYDHSKYEEMRRQQHKGHNSTYSTPLCPACSRTAALYNVLRPAGSHVCRISCFLCEKDVPKDNAVLYIGGCHGISYKNYYTHLATHGQSKDNNKSREVGACIRMVLLALENSLRDDTTEPRDTRNGVANRARVAYQSVDELNNAILRCIIQCNLPYNIVKSRAFKDLIFPHGTELR